MLVMPFLDMDLQTMTKLADMLMKCRLKPILTQAAPCQPVRGQTLHFSQQMVYPMFNKPEIAEKFRLAVQKLTGQNVRVVMQPMDTVTQINQRKIEELAHFPNVTIR